MTFFFSVEGFKRLQSIYAASVHGYNAETQKLSLLRVLDVKKKDKGHCSVLKLMRNSICTCETELYTNYGTKYCSYFPIDDNTHN